MKLKAFVFVCLLGLLSPLFAASKHVHANTENARVDAPRNTIVPMAAKGKAMPSATKMGWPGYCEIEIMNHSYSDVRVYGVFDDGLSMEPFNVYSYESPHYISLYYYGYCHDGMDVYIDTFYGSHVFAGYVRRYSTIRIVPSMFGGSVKATVQAK